MRTMHRLFTVAVAASLTLGLPAGVSAQAKPETKADFSGKWLFAVNSDAGTGTPTVTLKQQADTLTGHYSSQTLGEHDVKGTVKDKQITFSFTADLQGTALAVTYKGTIEADGTLKGTVDFGGMGSGTFTAKRQP